MSFFSKLSGFYEAWQAGLAVSENLIMLAVGISFMIGAVAALIWMRSNTTADQTGTVQDDAYTVPGERHIVARKKGCAFTRRLETLA
ncbi:hypothetical protein [Celeribacter litoreus]|uniref:hypothetical protein n=1 Tax=Celeribacter litoreus TaxID=2876714 RepID=UPI001CCFC8AE|nr:hypothetical protein [Celeribacter litoreus]MCA0044464.1 hypothetical protein [Celeribacter litoreus]